MFARFESYTLPVVHPTEPIDTLPSLPTPSAMSHSESATLEAILNLRMLSFPPLVTTHICRSSFAILECR